VSDAGAHIRSRARKRQRAALSNLLGMKSAADSDALLGISAIMLDAYDGAGGIPQHLTKPRFLRDCHAALADGGVVVANVFNGPSGSRSRAAIDLFVSQLEAAVGPVCTVPVISQPESLVLVARRGREQSRPSRTELMEGVRRSTGGGGLGIDAPALVSAMLWADCIGMESIVELIPPASTASVETASAAKALRAQLRPGSSACEWSRGGSDDEGGADEEGGGGIGGGGTVHGTALPQPEGTAVAASSLAVAGATASMLASTAPQIATAGGALTDAALSIASASPIN
jgi:hypothetical protein